MIYVLGWVVNYFLFFSSRYIGRRHAVAASILFVGAIAVLRGRVGTDTGFVYEPMASDISRLHNVEPLFGAWLSVLVAAFKDPLVAVTVGITSTFLLLLFIYLWRADSKELVALQVFYIPAIFYEHSMNTVRFGLAFAVLLLFTQSVRLREHKRAILLAIAAILLHYSSLVFLAIWLITRLDLDRMPDKAIAAISVVSLPVLFVLADTYIQRKSSLYLDDKFLAPSAYSGAGVVAVTALVLFGVISGRLENKDKAKVVIFGFLLVALSWVLTQYSYGGLRLLAIVELAVWYAAIASYQRARLRFERHLKVIFFFAGLVSIGFTYKHLLDEQLVVQHSSSPYLPYRFIWEER
jgi:hypothetical protein